MAATVIAGQGPLLWLLAAQILRLGGRIDRILDTTERKNYFAALPHAFAFLTSPYFAKGLALMREVKAKVPVVSGVSELAAAGDGQLATVTYVVGGKRETIPSGSAAAASGRRAQRQSGDGGRDRASLGRFAIVLVARARSRAAIRRSQASRSPATAPASAARMPPWSAAASRRALRSRCWRLRLPQSLHRWRPSAPISAKAERGRVFLDTLFRPAPQFRIPSGDTIVCRCEEVTAKDVLDAVAIGATGPNQLKAYRRTGMGPCQGRLCGLTVTELMAQARGKTPAGDRLLSSPRTGEADHAGRACVGAEERKPTSRPWCADDEARGCDRRGWRHPRMLDRASSVPRRHEAGADREGLRRPPRLRRECRRRSPTRKAYSRDPALDPLDGNLGADRTICSTTTCGFESHGQVLVAENDAEFDVCRARVAELNALGFTHEELIDAAGAAAARAGGGRELPRRGSVAARRRSRSGAERRRPSVARQKRSARPSRRRGGDQHSKAATGSGTSMSVPTPMRHRCSSTPPAPGPAGSPPHLASRCRSRPWRRC